MIIEIDALDTLFFRDGKPFNMGDQTWADGIFPPNPTVIRGALRTLFFSLNQNKFDNWLGDNGKDSTESLQINGFYLKKYNREGVSELLFPMPKDMVINKSKEPPSAALLHLVKLEATTNSSLPLHFMWDDDSKIESPDNAYIDQASFNRYLNTIENFVYYEQNELISVEPKVGIGRENSTRTTDECKLYRVGMLRPETIDNRISIVVELDGLTLPNDGLLKIGAEGKMASFKQTALEDLTPPKTILNDKSQFKVILATPAIFENGWKPAWINESQKTNGLEFEIVAAAIPGKKSIGGFDMKKKKEKPQKHAVPAGSVLVLQVTSNFSDRAAINNILAELFHHKNICDSDDYNRQGYGMAFVGGLQ